MGVQMISIDGSIGSGSGTVLRLAIAFSAILGEGLHIYNIRAKRKPPGLKTQHLKAVLAAAKLCNAEVENARIGSRELYFKPGGIDGGRIEVEIGTAGSIPMLFLTVLPICVFARRPVEVHVIRGGTDVYRAPTMGYLRKVLLPVLELMNVKADIEVKKYGYYPKGLGEAVLKVYPTRLIRGVDFSERGSILGLYGLSICTFLKDRRVADRQAKAAGNVLKSEGFHVNEIEVIYDFSNPAQKGSSIVLWAILECGSRIGADSIGALGKPSEVVGREAARKLLLELKSIATVDSHLADMLIPYIALAKSSSTFTVRTVTEHLSTNIRLAREILGVEFKIRRVGSAYRVERI